MSCIRDRPIAAVPSVMLVLSACAQGEFGVSPGTILYGVVLILVMLFVPGGLLEVGKRTAALVRGARASRA